MRVRTQMIIALGAVILLLLTGTGYLLRQLAGQRLREIGKIILLTQARGTASVVDAFIFRALENARSASLVPDFADFITLGPAGRDRAEAATVRKLHSVLNQEFSGDASFALLDLAGRDVLDTIPIRRGGSEAEAPWFLEPLRTRQPYVNITAAAGQREALWIGVPLTTGDGTIIGIIRMRYDEESLIKLVNHLPRMDGQPTLMAMLDDRSKRVVPCSAGFAPGRTVLPPDAFGRRGDGDETGSFWAAWSEAAVADGERDRVAYVKLVHIPWRVLFVRPAGAFFAVQSSFTNLLLIAGAVAASLGIAATLLISRRFTRPIEELAQASDRIAAGDLTITVSSRSRRDEIGELARRFDHMAGRLRVTLDERERQVAELARREERMRHLIDTLPLPMLLVDGQGRVRQVNQAFTATLGYTHHDAPDLAAWLNLAFPDATYRDRITRAGGFAPVAREPAGADRTGAGVETHVTCRDGTVRAIEWHATRLGDLSLIVGVDLTERKRGEDTLRESEARFRMLVEGSHELIVLTRPDGTIIYASANSAAITGYSVAETIGTPVLARVHPDDVPAAAAKLKEASGMSLLRYLFKDGSWHWLELSGRQFTLAGGEQCRVIVGRDVTARLAAEETNKRLAGELRQAQKMEAIGTLAGGIAHDFNNILTGILGNVQLMQMELPGGHSLEPLLANVERASLRARDLVARILAFSRRGGELHAVHDLVPIVREAIALLRASLPAAIAMHPQFPDRPLWVSCDPGQIHQAVMNFGTNAAYAMRGHGGRLTITIEEVTLRSACSTGQSRMPAGPAVCLAVMDTGEGMDAATRERIFEPFFTTKPVGEGSGLGLSVVHRIVEAHRGALEVESTPGVGTIFRVYFPFAQPEPAVAASTPPVIPSAPGTGQCVLCVDDEPDVAAVVARALTIQGYRPAVFLQPREALARFQQEPGAYSAVITDMAMPEMSGLELVGALRALRPDVPVLMVTGNPRPHEIERVRTEYHCQVLGKPFTLDKLAEAIRQMFNA